VSSAAAPSTVADVVAKPPEPPAPIAPPQPVQAEEVILTAQLVEVPPTPTSATAAGGSVVDLALAGGVERHADDDLPAPKAKANHHLATKLALAKGFCRTNGTVGPNDPPDRARRHPCKLFLVELEQGKTYVVEYRHMPGQFPGFQFDPYLRIETLQGQNVAED